MVSPSPGEAETGDLLTLRPQWSTLSSKTARAYIDAVSKSGGWEARLGAPVSVYRLLSYGHAPQSLGFFCLLACLIVFL